MACGNGLRGGARTAQAPHENADCGECDRTILSEVPDPHGILKSIPSMNSSLDDPNHVSGKAKWRAGMWTRSTEQLSEFFIGSILKDVREKRALEKEYLRMNTVIHSGDGVKRQVSCPSPDAPQQSWYVPPLFT